jgi:LPS-assembly lipoprotein
MANRQGLLAALLLVCVLPACGFQPVYGEKSAISTLSQTTRLEQVKLEVPHNRDGQFFANKLNDLLNPSHKRLSNHRYLLTAELIRQRTPVIVERDGSISRFNIAYNIRYRLRDSHGLLAEQQGTLRRLASYNVAVSDFSNVVAERDANDRALTELAHEMAYRLVNLLSKGQEPGQSL